MRKILLVISIASFSFASAQQKEIPGIKVIPPHSAPAIPQYPAGPLAEATLSHVLPNGNKVYLLPQDNMPCVVPDMSQFNTPVVQPPIPYYNIPNPALPQNKVAPLSPEKLKELKEWLEKQKSSR